MKIRISILSTDILVMTTLVSVMKSYSFVDIVYKADSLMGLDNGQLVNSDLIIIDCKSNTDSESKKVFDNLNGVSSAVTVLLDADVLDGSHSAFAKLYHIKRKGNKLNIIEFLSTFSRIVDNHFEGKKAHLVSTDYIAYRSSYIMMLTEVPCDIFIKINDLKYIKIYKKEDSTKGQLSKYIDKGIKYFYIKRNEYYDNFDDFYSQTLQVFDSIQKSDNNLELGYSNSQNFIFDLMNDIGISEAVVNVSNNYIDSISKELTTKEIKNLFKSFKYSKDRYIFDHSTMTSMFSISMCSNFDWRNEEVYKKLVAAALYHDFGFINPKLALIELDKNEIQNLSKSFRREILDHAEVMSLKLSGIKGIPTEVLQIVSKHHNLHHEYGYTPKNTGVQLGVLESIFIVSHEFTNNLYKIGFRLEKLPNAVKKTLEFIEANNIKSVKEPFLGMVKKVI